VNVAFLVNDLQLSGGIGVVVQHALQLVRRHGFEVSLVLVREQDDPHWAYDPLEHLRILSLPQACDEHYDLAIATWWETTLSLFDVPADRYAYFVQSLEDRFYEPADAAERLGAGLTLDLPVAFITEASWIADTLRELRPDALCALVRNGIDKQAFDAPEAIDVRIGAPLRVLVEGNPRSWFKHVHEAIEATGAMREAHHLTVVCGDREGLGDVRADRIVGPLSTAEMATLYGESDVLVKLSSVEGMFGPPLEAFHRGATCVTTQVTGYDEYVEHGWNALVCDWDDPNGTARALDLLARDRALLHFLRFNALHTARGWPDWEQQGSLMALALRRIRDAPSPGGEGAARALTSGLAAGVHLYTTHMQQRNEYARQATAISRLRKHPALVWAKRVRNRRWARAITWPLRRLLPGTMRRLLGP
jgi:glycosyltransferase involved in cell wall biosynthesis